MTLARISLDVEPGARSVAAARRWAVSACQKLDRAELAECAALGVSELVTNALLHALPPIRVTLGGTLEHPRFEVSDGSPTPPLRRIDFDPMSTTGRGVELVMMCSTMWGVEIDGSRKTVWFEPAADTDPTRVSSYTFHQTAPAPNLADSPPDSSTGGCDPEESYAVRLLDVDIDQGLELHAHYQDLRRELRLLAMTRERDYPLAVRMSTTLSVFDPAFPGEVITQLRTAAAEGRRRAEISVTAPRALVGLIPQIIDVLDLADSFSRAQRLLTAVRSPHDLAFGRWFFGEFQRQAEGSAPTRFGDLADEQPTS